MSLTPLLVFMLLLVFSTATSTNVVDPNTEVENDFVRDTCNKTTMKELCISVVDSDVREDLKLNSTGVLVMFTNHTFYAVVNDEVYLYDTVQDNDHLTNETKQALFDCLKRFETSQETLGYIVEEKLVKQKNPDLNSDLSVVANWFQACENGFKGKSTAEPSAWKLRYDHTRSLLMLSLEMTNLIKCGHVVC